MKFSVGYNMRQSERLIPAIIKNQSLITEVYFSWGDFANGRNSQLESSDLTAWEAYAKAERDLRRLNKSGIDFNLLFNANCYGAESLSRALYNKIGECADYIKREMNLKSVTTTSPLIAKFFKNNFSDIKVRASVNMELGTVRAMSYLTEYFDGYYMKREHNRDFKRIRELKAWCEANGKSLHILANSGCLNDCSAHIFHDNLVAHEAEIAGRDNCYTFDGVCKAYLKNPENRRFFIRDTNFIRPEDIGYYEEFFDAVKLATRVSNHAAVIVESYAKGAYSGNITELLEPDHSAALYPYAVDNGKLTNDYLFCNKECSECGRCEIICENAFVNLEKFYY